MSETTAGSATKDDGGSTRRILFLSAGAGSGKTFRLTEMIRQRLASGAVEAAGLLATTFTRRAAAELKERVRGELIEAGQLQLAERVGEARVGTVNAVCGELVKRFSFEMGLSPELRVIDEAEARRLLAETVDQILDPDQAEALSRLTWRFGIEDEAAVIARLVDAARSNDIAPQVLGGFGPRNTDDLVGALCESPVLPDLDAEVRSVIDRHLPALLVAVSGPKAKKNTRTFLAAVQRFRRDLDHGTPDWAQWAALAGAGKPEVALHAIADQIQTVVGRFTAHPLLADDIGAYLSLVFELAAGALQRYQDQKQRQGLIDFVDQEALLYHHLDHPRVREVLHEELQMVVVDEFQDTSPLQLAIFLRLSEIAAETVWVGDIKQAIYGFRGSDAVLMQSVLDTLPAVGGVVETMGDSWRSRPALVALNNRVFARAFADSLRPEQVVLQPRRPELQPDATVYEVWHVPGKNKGLRHAGLIRGLATLMASGRAVVDKKSGSPRPLRWQDIAILAAKNNDVAGLGAALQAAGIPCRLGGAGLLERAEVVLALACLRRLYDERDTVSSAIIMSLADGQEPEQWLADRFDYLRRFPDRGDRHRWREREDDPAAAPHPLLAQLAGLRDRLAILTPREALGAVLQAADLGKVVMGWSQDRDLGLARLENLDALMALAERYEDEREQRGAPGTLPDFLQWLDQLAQDEKDEQAPVDADAVHVMTHHGAKGLEWPVVVLMDLHQDIKTDLWGVRTESVQPLRIAAPLAGRFVRYWPWPFGARKKVMAAQRVEQGPLGIACAARAIEERRRLLYVSMTRPRDLLVLAVTRTAWDANTWLQQTTSSPELLAVAESDGTCLPAQWGIPNRFDVWDDRAGTQADALQARNGRALHWPQSAVLPQAYPRLMFNPSQAQAAAACIVQTDTVGVPLAVGPSAERSAVGTLVHAVFASAISQGRAATAERVNDLIRQHGLESALTGEGVARFAEDLLAWLRRRWPGSSATAEVPIDVRMPDGRICRGQIDLLVQTTDRCVIIDHKTGFGSRSKGAEAFDGYFGQLSAYAVALQQGSKPVETWVLMPETGTAVHLATERPSGA